MKKKTLVLGASLKEDRYSNIAIKKLILKKYEVKAIGATEGKVDSVKIESGYPRIKDVHTVTLYLNPKKQEEYYEYIFSLAPKRVIFNPGTENVEFIKRLQLKNIEAEVACTLVLLTINQY